MSIPARAIVIQSNSKGWYTNQYSRIFREGLVASTRHGVFSQFPKYHGCYNKHCPNHSPDSWKKPDCMATWQVFFLHLKYWEHHPLCSFLLHRWQRWWAMLSCWVALCHSNSTAGCVVLKARLTRFSGHGNISAYYHQVERKRGREDSFQSPSDRYQCPWMLMPKYVYIILPPFTSRICVIDVYS